MRLGQLILVLILAAFAAGGGDSAGAAESKSPSNKMKCVASVQIENDLFGSGEDNHFTHGTRFSMLVPASLDEDRNDCRPLRQLVKPGFDLVETFLPEFLFPRNNRLSFSVGQNIFTPDEITNPGLIQDDRPYAGWLYAGFGFVTETDRNRKRDKGQIFENLELDLGIVGPSSFADEVQTEWHALINTRTPRGWDNQLKDEIGVLLTYERKWLSPEYPFGIFSYDVAPSWGAAVGNVYTYGATGVTLRFGQDLPNDYGPPRIRPALQGGGFFEPNDGFGWYIFAGVEGRAVADGILYEGTFNRALIALDAKTGAQKWRFPVGGIMRASPGMADGMVYVGADDTKFYGLDAATGRAVWTFDLGRGGQQSSPAITEGKVYVGAFDHHVYALDAKSGREIWRFKTGGGVLSSPLVAGRRVIIGSTDGSIYALSADKGEQIWKHVTDGAVYSSPALAGELIYIGSDDGKVRALVAGSGDEAWAFDVGREVFSTPAVRDGTVYVGAHSSYLYALNANSGELRWRRYLGGAIFSSPAVSEARVYVGSSDGTLYALDRRTGAVVWGYRVGPRIWTSPALVDGVLYFGAHDGAIYALRVE